MNTRSSLWVLSMIGAIFLFLHSEAGHARAITAPGNRLDSISIVGGTSFGGAVAIDPGNQYMAAVDGTRKKEFYVIDIAPGQQFTWVYTSSVQWTDSVAFKLWDQTHLSPIASQYVSGGEQSYSFTQMGSDSSPTRYFFTAELNGNRQSVYSFQVTVSSQNDANQAGDAGETATSARLITPTLGAIITYDNNLLGFSDKEDRFKIDAPSGMAVTVTLRVDDYAGASGLFTEFLDQESHKLASGYLSAATSEPTVFHFMSNRSAPSAYFVRLRMNGLGTKPLTYQFDVETAQQRDANGTGDAGDDFDHALLITPTLEASYNLLGSADNDDYYRIDLPIDPSSGEGLGLPYSMMVAPLPWTPGSSGLISFQIYNPDHTPRGRATEILAPSTTSVVLNLTDCDLCYVKVNDQSTGTRQLLYSFTLSAPKQLFLPMVVR